MKRVLEAPDLDKLEIISKYTLFGRYLCTDRKYKYWASNIPLDIVSGVYILLSRGKVVRVGQATDIWAKLQQHHTKLSNWDSFIVIPNLPANDRCIIELVYAIYFKPVHNIKFNNRV